MEEVGVTQFALNRNIERKFSKREYNLSCVRREILFIKFEDNFPVDTGSVSNNASILTEKFSDMFCIMSCHCSMSRNLKNWFFVIFKIKANWMHYLSNLS